MLRTPSTPRPAFLPRGDPFVAVRTRDGHAHSWRPRHAGTARRPESAFRTHIPAPSSRIGTSRRTPVPENPAPTAPRMPPGSTSRPAASCVAGGVGAMRHRLSPRLCRARGLHPPRASADRAMRRSHPPPCRAHAPSRSHRQRGSSPCSSRPCRCPALSFPCSRLGCRSGTATSGSPPRGRSDSSSFAALAGPIRRELPGGNFRNLLNAFTPS